MLYHWTFWLAWCEVWKLETCKVIINRKLSIFLEAWNRWYADACWILYACLGDLKSIWIDWFWACQVRISYLYI